MTTDGDIKAGKWETYLGHRLRIYSGADLNREQGPVAEGTVVGVITCPSLIIEHADGTRSHHASTLPTEVMKWDPL